MKYVIMKCQTTGHEALITFDEKLVHLMIARGASCRSPYKAISAGFCYKDKNGWHTCGESESLDIGPRPEDAAIIQSEMGF